MTSLYLNELYKDPISTYSHDMRYWGEGVQPKMACREMETRMDFEF